MITQSWFKALVAFFGGVVGISVATVVVTIGICWYREVLSLGALGTALQWAGVIVGGVGVWSVIGSGGVSAHGTQSSHYYNYYSLLPRDPKLWQADMLAAYRFSITAMLAGLLTVGIGTILGSWVG